MLITGSDMLYFYAVNQEDALISVISITRRSSVLVTFLGGALVFREHNIREKFIELVIMLAGVILLLFSS